jgi:hypothetical protein
MQNKQAELKHYIVIGNRKYEYVLKPARTCTVLVCEGAGLEQKYSNSEIPAVLADLQNIIIKFTEQSSEVQSEALRFRVSPSEKEQIMHDAYNAGYESVSAYLRSKILGDVGLIR